MNAIAIITARGGSKRIPGKNMRDFCGKPILAYSVKAALQSGLFEEVMVSTDSEAIADVAKAYGASVPFLRSAKTSGDYATTADVLSEVIEKYRDLGGMFDCFCCIYPTAPFLTAEKLRNAFAAFTETGADSLIPVIRFSYPPQRALIVRDGQLAYQSPEYAAARSQDLEPFYHDCGQFYLCKTEPFLRRHSILTPTSIPFILPEEETQDIDNESDWIIAEWKFKAMRDKAANGS